MANMDAMKNTDTASTDAANMDAMKNTDMANKDVASTDAANMGVMKNTDMASTDMAGKDAASTDMAAHAARRVRVITKEADIMAEKERMLRPTTPLTRARWILPIRAQL
jgi:hypothetical protein